MVKLIKADFDGHVMQFNDSGWFNATAAADKFGKRVQHWLDNKETQEYIEKLNHRISGDLNTVPAGIIKTQKGRNGGTWLHPKLAVSFARWLSVDFSIWCDDQIDKIIHGERESIDWGMLRHASKSSNKVANEILQMVRSEQGKETKSFHYANEAKLVNYALTGRFEPIDRDSLSADDLDLLASLENRNSVLIGRDVDRETRKEVLLQMATAHRTRIAPNKKSPHLEVFFCWALLHLLPRHIYSTIYTTTRQVVDMAVEQRVHKFVKIRKSANDKVQELADRKYNGNWHAAIHQIIEESKA